MTVSTINRPVIEHEFERLRPSLVGYCYRMLGSGFEAEDAVQETLIRAWKKTETLKEQAALKAWLFRIATNVCLDQIDARKRRARPVDLSEPGTAATPVGEPVTESAWILPIADGQVTDPAAGPEALAADRESLRLAFVAALQHLPATQRVVLVLREALRWSAREVAELLDTSVASVNSLLQRARASLDQLDLADREVPVRPEGEAEQHLLEEYLEAFAEYDIDRIVTLLRDDAVFDMPPLPLWIRGAAESGRFMLGPGAACRGSKLIGVRANGGPGFASYKPDPQTGDWRPWSLALLDLDAEGTGPPRVSGVHNFLDPFLPGLFQSFGLPDRRTDGDPAVDPGSLF